MQHADIKTFKNYVKVRIFFVQYWLEICTWSQFLPLVTIPIEMSSIGMLVLLFLIALKVILLFFFKSRVILEEPCSHTLNKGTIIQLYNSIQCGAGTQSNGDGKSQGGGALPIMNYMGRLHTKGVPFQDGGIYM